jgi:tRNA(fMet)-specific endonuclease VapC
VIHLDTSFAIDLFREARRGRFGPAHTLLETLQDEAIGVSCFVVCELYDGLMGSSRSEEERAAITGLLGALDIAYPDDRFAERYAQVIHHLRKRSRTVATMDLMIGVSALVERAKLVTGNRKHFAMMPDLEIVPY